MAQKPRRRVAIVPHTHWDREWYQPYQTFRLRLVDLLDEFLPRLDRDPAYARFMLDGQMAVVDDYLEVRPEAEPVLRRLAGSGRLSMGPWYILMDEFLVSGETIVRDLQLGLERAAAFGGAMPVGYLPDMFGHVAQMPQLLRQAGLEHAVVWRGVPAAVDRTGFWWTAPDGSTVRAEYLWVGYGNGAAVPDDAKALVARIRAHVDELGDALPAGAPLLWMNGTDHQVPQPWLGRVVAEVNEIQDDYKLVVTSLAEYLPTAPVEGLPEWTGELRSGARANLLMGVASNRVDVKQAAARAELALERRAEPLSALFLPAEQWPGRLLDLAWREVIRNAAHDSICACSVDEVGAAVLHRFAEATQIATGLARRAVRALGRSMTDPGTVVVNASARTRGGLVELVLPAAAPADDTPSGASPSGYTPLQVLARGVPATETRTMAARAFNPFIGDLVNRAALDRTTVTRVEWGDDDTVVLRVGAGGIGRDTGSRLAELFARAGAMHDEPLRVEVRHEGWRRVLARVDDVPGLGWATWTGEARALDPVRAEQATGTLDNGLVRIEVDPTDGTFSIDGVAGLGRLVDDGDAGDTYNYSPPPVDAVVDSPSAVRIDVEETGPLRARVLVTRTFTWPERVEGGSRQGERVVDVATRLELRAGERLLRVETSFDNPSRDHRLRAWFPLPTPTDRSRAECAFAVVERGLEAEGGAHERPLPTFPSRRFVQAGGLTVVHEGLLEYELVQGGRALAVTLLRATGVISGNGDMAYRPWPAGPPMPAGAAQLIGPVRVRYCLYVGDAEPYALVDDAFLPLEVVQAPGGGDRPGRGAALTVDGAEVSAVVRRAGALEVRVFNPSAEATTVDLGGRSGWLMDLRGRPLQPFDGRFALRPWGIATARITES
ncbi:MAG: alpha-mannosidase [Actinobacteria bacterium]|nr:MAG: alpha-mannosidase [Actinomycetota bacterium]